MPLDEADGCNDGLEARPPCSESDRTGRGKYTVSRKNYKCLRTFITVSSELDTRRPGPHRMAHLCCARRTIFPTGY